MASDVMKQCAGMEASGVGRLGKMGASCSGDGQFCRCDKVPGEHDRYAGFVLL